MDRLLALIMGLRYRTVMTLRRVRVVIILFCLLSGIFGWWQHSAVDRKSTRSVLIVLMLLSLVVSFFCYTKIYLRLRHHQIQIQDHQQQQRQPRNGGEIPLNTARYKKTVFSIAWVQLTLLICYLPFSVIGMLVIYGEKPGSAPGGPSLASLYSAVSIFFLNSSLNPILYCWKIREVRQAARETIRQLNCFSAA